MNQLTTFLLALTFQENFNQKLRLEIGRLLKRETSDIDTEDAFKTKLKTLFERVREQAWYSAKTELDAAAKHQVQVINLLDETYPFNLLQIPDAPLVLFVRAEASWLKRSSSKPVSLQENSFSLALVGSRRCTDYGARFARFLSRQVVEHGGIVVSGLADGIDTQAHRGALEAVMMIAKVGIEEALGGNGRQPCAGIAVLGSGVLSIYPERNSGLAAQIVENNGAIISEYGLFTKPRPYFFPERNRIISGLSDGVVVVEARKRSGALITARLALEQGREVFSPPGSVESLASEGSNQLLKDGAVLLRNFDDVLEALPRLRQRILRHRENLRSRLGDTGAEVSLSSSLPCSLREKPFTEIGPGLTKEEHQSARQLIELLRHNGKCHFDALVSGLGLSSPRLSSLLSTLELADIISCHPGNWYSTRSFADGG